jgi:L-fuconolactonase
MTVIDAHLHVWDLGRFTYPWLTPASAVLHRDRTIHEALEVMHANGVSGALLVEANNSLEEAHWLLELAEVHPEILGVVGWCDLNSTTLECDLEPLAHHPKFKGVRPTLPPPDADDEAWNALNRGLEVLETFNLSCDLLVQGRPPAHLLPLIAAHPGLRFILDHLGGPVIAPHHHSRWAEALEGFAPHRNVNLKISGFLTAAEHKPLTTATLAPFVRTVLEQFGPERLMFGSDWPVSTLAGQYADTLHTLQQTMHLDADCCHQIFEGTARRVYELAPEAVQRRVPTMS